jgi:hypothetical protein
VSIFLQKQQKSRTALQFLRTFSNRFSLLCSCLAVLNAHACVCVRVCVCVCTHPRDVFVIILWVLAVFMLC